MTDRKPGPGETSADRSTHPDPVFFADAPLIPAALDAGMIGIWSLDLATNALSWSSNLASLHLSASASEATTAGFEQQIHPDDRAAVGAAMQDCRRSWRPFRVRYRLAPKSDDAARWMEMRGAVDAAGGMPVRLIGTCHDVTEEVALDHELDRRTSQQNAIVRLAETGLSELNLETFLVTLVDIVAEAVAADLVDMFEVLPGDAEALLRAGTGWNSGLVGAARIPLTKGSHSEFTLSGNEPVVIDFEAETRFPPPSLLREHGVVCAMTVPISGRDGRPFGRLGVHRRSRRRFNGLETSFLAVVANLVSGTIQRHQLNDRHQLMIRELRHRSGNLFAQLLALFSQTAKTSRSVAELATKYDARVLALANAHRLITEGGWSSTPLSELLRALLAAYLDRTTLHGPSVRLGPDPAFGLSTAVHELSANAIKYGSLSQPSGHIELTWSVAHTNGGATLFLDWTESNGPRPGRSRRRGFGSRLVETVIQRQLNGDVQWDYQPEGLHVQMQIPLGRERWPSSPDQQSPGGVA
jgi:two-component sensor histidine kinase